MLNNLQLLRLKAASKRAIHKTAEETGSLIGNKTSEEIMKVSKKLQQNN